jgi:tetratricopeptide (TPR) repeat protein
VDYFDRFWGTINTSADLWKLGDHQKALKILDDAIAYWIQDGSINHIRTLCHHAAVLCDSAGKLGLVKHYYEQSLTYSPEYPVALYGLAEAMLKQGETALAKEYAKRSYNSAAQDDDDVAKRELLDLIAKKWPDIGN